MMTPMVFTTEVTQADGIKIMLQVKVTVILFMVIVNSKDDDLCEVLY